MTRRRFIAQCGLLPLSALLAGCGFKLKGSQRLPLEGLPFDTLYLEAGRSASLVAVLRRQLATGAGIRLVDAPSEAQAQLELLRDERSRDILSLTGAGRVREYQLIQTVIFRVVGRDGEEWLPASSVTVRRDYSFDDAQVIAREQEEAMLVRDMEADLAQQIMRRLAAIRR